MPYDIRKGTSADFEAVMAINQQSRPGVSALDYQEFTQLCSISDYFRVVETEQKIAAYLFALNHKADYDGEEFLWLQTHMNTAFHYIDQVAVASTYRQHGLATALYNDLSHHALIYKSRLLLCEVNHTPPNIESQQFHARLGFTEIHQMNTRSLVVSLLSKQLSPHTP